MANPIDTAADRPLPPEAGLDFAGLADIAALRASQARFCAIADLVPDLLWRNDTFTVRLPSP